MRRRFAFTLLAIFIPRLIFGQKDGDSVASGTVVGGDARPKTYNYGPEVVAPVPLFVEMPTVLGKGCEQKQQGKVTLAQIVDATGMPRSIYFLHPIGTDLDQLALMVASADRFKPGLHEGIPVEVAQSVEVEMQACVETASNSDGNMVNVLRLQSQPVQKFGKLSEKQIKPGTQGSLETAVNHFGVSPPVPLYVQEPEHSDEVKKLGSSGICLVSLVIDRNGLPQNVRVSKKLNPELDRIAVAAVSRYRFKPAMKDGQPFPVMIEIAVNFQVH